MRAILSILGLSLGLSAVASTSTYADTALLVVNDRYRNAQNLQEADTLEALRRPLQRAGFDVILVSDDDAAAMRDGLDQLLRAEEDERILIALAGHFVRSARDTWLLGRYSNAPSLAQVGGAGLSLNAVMEVAATAPGRSIVLLGQERRRIEIGAGLGAGIGQVDPPNGVAAVAGAPGDLADLVRDGLLVPGTSLAAALDGRQFLRPFGFVSDAVPFLPGAEGAAPAPVVPDLPPATPVAPSAAEIALWNAAQELNTSAAYRAYLSRFPDGAFEAEARARVNAIENDPIARAQAIEEALGLTGAQRRSIQSDLTVLGFDTRGVDGIFGSGTRNALLSWQAERGVAQTGYIDAPQIAALAEQARVRRAQIEEEERQAREEAERQDRAFWQITGQASDREGAETYLERYPEGLFADRARNRLARFDNAAWTAARDVGTIPAFRAYLNAWPEGRHADEARRAIRDLRNPGGGGNGGGGNGNGGGGNGGGAGLGYTPNDGQLARENSLNLPPITRSILEQRLAATGFNPGRVDGRFDDMTRRAIAAYQQSRGLDASGYFNQITVARLLAESFGGVIQLDGVLR